MSIEPTDHNIIKAMHFLHSTSLESEYVNTCIYQAELLNTMVFERFETFRDWRRNDSLIAKNFGSDFIQYSQAFSICRAHNADTMLFVAQSLSTFQNDLKLLLFQNIKDREKTFWNKFEKHTSTLDECLMDVRDSLADLVRLTQRVAQKDGQLVRECSNVLDALCFPYRAGQLKVFPVSGAPHIS